MYIVYIYNFVKRDKVLVNNAFLVVAVLENPQQENHLYSKLGSNFGGMMYEE